jgi:hypothetical protein
MSSWTVRLQLTQNSKKLPHISCTCHTTESTYISNLTTDVAYGPENKIGNGRQQGILSRKKRGKSDNSIFFQFHYNSTLYKYFGKNSEQGQIFAASVQSRVAGK